MQQIAGMAPFLGSIIQGGAQLSQGSQVKRASYFEAAQLDANAQQAIAASHSNAQDKLRKYELLQSRALAIAGASGAGALDPQIVDIISGIAGEGSLEVQKELFQGKEKARGFTNQALATRFTGKAAKKASRTTAVATILGGAGQGAINYFGAGRLTNRSTLAGFG